MGIARKVFVMGIVSGVLGCSSGPVDDDLVGQWQATAPGGFRMTMTIDGDGQYRLDPSDFAAPPIEFGTMEATGGVWRVVKATGATDGGSYDLTRGGQVIMTSNMGGNLSFSRIGDVPDPNAPRLAPPGIPFGPGSLGGQPLPMMPPAGDPPPSLHQGAFGIPEPSEAAAMMAQNRGAFGPPVAVASPPVVPTAPTPPLAPTQMAGLPTDNSISNPTPANTPPPAVASTPQVANNPLPPGFPAPNMPEVPPLPRQESTKGACALLGIDQLNRLLGTDFTQSEDVRSNRSGSCRFRSVTQRFEFTRFDGKSYGPNDRQFRRLANIDGKAKFLTGVGQDAYYRDHIDQELRLHMITRGADWRLKWAGTNWMQQRPTPADAPGFIEVAKQLAATAP